MSDQRVTKPFMWGVWQWRGNDRHEFRPPDPRRPYLEELVLARCSYGTVTLDRKEKEALTIIASTAAGHGGETSIEVSDLDAALIVEALSMADLITAIESAGYDWAIQRTHAGYHAAVAKRPSSYLGDDLAHRGESGATPFLALYATWGEELKSAAAPPPLAEDSDG